MTPRVAPVLTEPEVEDLLQPQVLAGGALRAISEAHRERLRGKRRERYRHLMQEKRGSEAKIKRGGISRVAIRLADRPYGPRGGDPASPRQAGDRVADARHGPPPL